MFSPCLAAALAHAAAHPRPRPHARPHPGRRPPWPQEAHTRIRSDRPSASPRPSRSSHRRRPSIRSDQPPSMPQPAQPAPSMPPASPCVPPASLQHAPLTVPGLRAGAGQNEHPKTPNPKTPKPLLNEIIIINKIGILNHITLIIIIIGASYLRSIQKVSSHAKLLLI